MPERNSRFRTFLMFILLLGIAISFVSCPQNTSVPVNQEILANNSNQPTALQYFDETITINGSIFEPEFTNSLPGELIDGSQWLLIYWWENHEINTEGLGIDWGYFCSIGDSCATILMAKCHDPQAPNPTPGQTVYTYFASETLLKVPGNTSLQRFQPISEVVNIMIPTATFSITPTPTINTEEESVVISGTTPTPTKQKGIVEKLIQGAGFMTAVLVAIVLVLIGWFLKLIKDANPDIKGEK